MLDQLVKDKITQEETHIRTGEESKDEELVLMMPYEALWTDHNLHFPFFSATCGEEVAESGLGLNWGEGCGGSGSEEKIFLV